MTGTGEQTTEAGGAVYSVPFGLSLIYNFYVLGFSNTFVWRCPTTSILLPFFRKHRTSKHLDIGVGTGYYIDNGDFPPGADITLVDINPVCLQYCKKIVTNSKLKITTYAHDIEKPLDCPNGAKFDSISLMYLLHCMPGPMSRKTALFKHLKTCLSINGSVFGATILGKNVVHNWLGRLLIWFYNKKGIFGNVEDEANSIIEALKTQFEDVDARIEGTVLLFTARQPRK